jgi:hypothetical protein
MTITKLYIENEWTTGEIQFWNEKTNEDDKWDHVFSVYLWHVLVILAGIVFLSLR